MNAVSAPQLRAMPRADLLPVQRKATRAYRVARLVVRPMLRALFDIHVAGADNAPAASGYVLIANHLNWIDSFVITLALPPEPRLHFLGDPTLLQTRRFQWRFVRSIGGYIPVSKREANGPALYRHVDLCLRRGGVVALYPEGHYGDAEGTMGEFKKGFAHFAVSNGVPVLPVALSGTKDLWLRKRIDVIVGEPISADGCSVDELVREGHQRVARLVPAYSEPRGVRLLQKRLTSLF